MSPLWGFVHIFFLFYQNVSPLGFNTALLFDDAFAFNQPQRGGILVAKKCYAKLKAPPRRATFFAGIILILKNQQRV